MARPKYGSDFVVDLLRALGIEYVAFNPGASFRGLHDSLVNYGNGGPGIITCVHEEIAVAIAHGYGRAAGRPMVAVLHNVVGLLHGAMAIFNAWCDRTPVLLLGGTGPMAIEKRRPWIDWIHTALVQGNAIRDYVKWDDQPASLASVPDSLVRAYRLAVTEPTAPVYVCLDAELQEMSLDGLDVPEMPDLARFAPPTPPQADPAALQKLAEWLVEAQRPVIVADRAGRSSEAVDALVQLAEFLGAPVVDRWNRFNFPNTHPLDLTGAEDELYEEADMILALEVGDLFGETSRIDRVLRRTTRRLSAGCRVAHITLAHYLVRSWAADYQRLPEVDLAISAEVALALPALLRACRERLAADAELEAAFQARRQARLAELKRRHQALRAQWEDAARRGESEQPVHLATLAREVYQVIREEDWVLANGDLHGWARRILPFDRPYRWQGGKMGGGVGYGAGVSLGVALANRGTGRLIVNFQPDGDLLYTPGALWTAAHHRIPVLFILFNNRSYYNSEEHALNLARARRRPEANAWIGTTLREPEVDFVRMAQSFGVHGEGPVTRPEAVQEAVRRALHVVKHEGRPALVDVHCQPR